MKHLAKRDCGSVAPAFPEAPAGWRGYCTAYGEDANTWSTLGRPFVMLTSMDDDNEPEMLGPVLSRFAPGWGASIDCGEGWWPIIVQLDRDVAALARNIRFTK